MSVTNMKLPPLPVTLSVLHLKPPISALYKQSGVQSILPASNTSNSIPFKAIIVESNSTNLVLKSFYDKNIANKTFDGVKYKLSTLSALGFSHCAFTTGFGQMQGQPALNDRTAPRFKVDGAAPIPFGCHGHSFTDDFLVCDHIFSQQEYELEFVAVLGLGFLKKYFIQAQFAETGYDIQLPPFPSTKMAELIAYTDGCCLSNGKGTVDDPARAGYGIHFPSLPTGWDMYGRLSPDDIHTNQRAELVAVIRALQLIRIRKIPCDRVCVRTDSQYAVQGLNEWIPRWRTKGYRTSKNHGVVNANLFQSLDQEVSALERTGVPVHLSHVPREANQKADALSKLGATCCVPEFKLPVSSTGDKPSPNLGPGPQMIIGGPLMLKALPLVQWTPDGEYWAQHRPIETWSDEPSGLPEMSA